MKIIVCIKQVPDTETKIQLTDDKKDILKNNIKWIINPYDEFAIEEALKIKESLGSGKVSLLSLGPKDRVKDALRTGLAMGADEGIVIDTEEPLDYFASAKILAQYIQNHLQDFQLILTGKLAIDDNNFSVGQAIAQFLEIPHVTNITKLQTENDTFTVEREIEGGAKEIFQVKGPAIFSANKGLNTPRYATVKGIMMAKRKPLTEISLSEVGTSVEPLSLFEHFELPKERPEVRFLEGEPQEQAKTLVNLLRNEAKVI
ncbi:MAG: electron transfer flavoprotein beta subunit/FixA family protein [Bdellovibrio sp.]|nr:MAG: electron transfer flavoprotein beta subunit/FixA family protein [Bdellovibrio sp.]